MHTAAIRSRGHRQGSELTGPPLSTSGCRCLIAHESSSNKQRGETPFTLLNRNQANALAIKVLLPLPSRTQQSRPYSSLALRAARLEALRSLLASFLSRSSFFTLTWSLKTLYFLRTALSQSG